MNKIYRIIWSRARGCYVVAQEFASGMGKSSSVSLIAAAGLLAFGTDQAVAASSVCGGNGSTVSASQTSGITWSTGDCTVSTGVSVTGTVAISVSNASVGTLTNSGQLDGTSRSGGVNVGSAGTISRIENTVDGTMTASYYALLLNHGVVGTLDNSGLISSQYGIYNQQGTISVLNNSGIISGTNVGIIDNGQGVGAMIEVLNNSGTISGGTYGIYINNGGTIGALNNTGLIKGAQTAIAIDGSSSLVSISNAGTIAGKINNDSGTALTITGGTGTIFGVLTGYNGNTSSGNIGTIISAAGLTFGSGNQLLNDNISVGSNGTVTSTGGVLQVNNPITITGNYHQESDATLLIGVSDNAVATGVVSADSGYGRLVVSGNAVVDSGSTIALTTTGSTYAFAAGQKYVVIQAAGSGTNYNADSLVYTVTGYTATGQSVTDSDNNSYTDLVVTLSGSSGSTSSGTSGLATTSNAQTLLSNLNHYSGTNQNLLNVYNSVLALTDTASANKAGAQLSPAATTNAAASATTQVFSAVHVATDNRLDTVRSNQASANGSGVATGEFSYDPAVWGRAFGGIANQGERDGVSGYHASYTGFMLGGDALVRPDWRLGGLFSYAHTNVNNDGDNSGSSATVNSYGLTAYAGYDGKPWYLNLTAGMERQLYNTTRLVDYTGFSGAANGNYNGMLYMTTVQAGYPIQIGDAMITPLAGVSYSVLHQDAYTESGGNGAALSVNDSTATSLKSQLGAKYERSVMTSYGELKPFVQMGWNHEFHDTALTTSGLFAADTTGTTAFTTKGASPHSNTLQLSLGATLFKTRNLTLSARYTLEGAAGYSAQTGDVTLRWQY